MSVPLSYPSVIDPLVILQGDALATLRTLAAESVHCCVTSPPYWGLRDYGVAGQLGLEPTPGEYVERMVGVFREVRRVLRADGTLWLNLGDRYASGGGSGAQGTTGDRADRTHTQEFLGVNRGRRQVGDTKNPLANFVEMGPNRMPISGLKPKDLVGIPWRVAFALQADGWWLRSDIIWAKPNPMPESVTDRPTKAHEMVFLMAKSERYHYDAKAIAEPVTDATNARLLRAHTGYAPPGQVPHNGCAAPRPSRRQRQPEGGLAASPQIEDDPDAFSDTRNARTVWTIATTPYAEAHFATFPEELARRCILAGCPMGGTVIDPFAGSGTVGAVALKNGRGAVLIELNAEYVALIQKRCAVTLSLGLEGGVTTKSGQHAPEPEAKEGLR